MWVERPTRRRVFIKHQMSRLLRLAVWRTQSRPSFFFTSIQRHCGSIGCRPSHDRRITVSHGQQTFASRGFSRFPGLFSRLPADNQKQNNEGPKTDPVSETPRRREMIYTVPNFLTFTRLLLSPVLGYFIIQNDFRTAFGLFLYMGATDFVDGYIARRLDQRTLLGTVMDPLADKVLMATMTIALTSADRLPLYLGVLILGRDFALVVASFYMRWRSLPQPVCFLLKRRFKSHGPTLIFPALLAEFCKVLGPISSDCRDHS